MVLRWILFPLALESVFKKELLLLTKVGQKRPSSGFAARRFAARREAARRPPVVGFGKPCALSREAARGAPPRLKLACLLQFTGDQVLKTDHSILRSSRRF